MSKDSPLESEGDMCIRHYLATYTLIDGEHAYVGRLLIDAFEGQEAYAFANSLAHETDCWSDECSQEHPWSCGDGTTASKLSDIRELSEEQFAVAKEVMGLLTYEAEYAHTAGK